MTEKIIALLSDKLNRTLTKDDELAFMDYCAFYGVEKSKEEEYTDLFVKDCYHIDEIGNLDLNTPDELPFAHQVHKDNWHQYSWGGCTITKLA
ncbi:MAG: hypothetical protein ACLRFP_00920 [Alphaproteobacteria bacterium]